MMWFVWIVALGALWRIVLGGLFGLPRWAVVASYPVVVSPLWWLAQWQFALAAHAFAALYWLPGHTWTDLGAMVERYGIPIGLVWHWITKCVPDRYYPTRVAEGVASGLYHAVLVVLATA